MSVNVMCTRAWEGCHFLTSKNTQFLASSKVTRVSIKQVQFPYSQQLTYTVHTDTGHVPSSFVRDVHKCFAKVEYFQLTRLTRKRQICVICTYTRIRVYSQSVYNLPAQKNCIRFLV